VFLRRVPLLSRRQLLLPLIALLAALAVPSAAGARAPKDFVGLSSEDVFAGNAAYRNAQLSDQKSKRVGLHRQFFSWERIEKSPGVYDFSTYDAYVLQAASHGISILPILQRAPSFYARSPVGTTIFPPRSNAPFAAFAAAVVRRYGPSGTLWNANPAARKYAIRNVQVWNEPSLRQYWGGRPSARQYVKMLKAVRKAVRGADRRVKIVTAGIPPSTQSGAVRITKFITQMYKAGGRRAFDYLAINSYARNQKELLRLLKKIRKLMNKRRDRRKQIWITEIGWGDKGPRHRFVVGARKQASLTTKSIRTIKKYRRRLRLRGFVYFSWRDGQPYGSGDQWGLHTGLLRLDGSHKPAYNAFARATRGL
jgi:hypothetical protein